MARIISILVLVIAILAIVDVLNKVYETEKKILWIAVIILVPLFGSLAWYAISRKIINL
jgi:hypothetical protein